MYNSIRQWIVTYVIKCGSYLMINVQTLPGHPHPLKLVSTEFRMRHIQFLLLKFSQV